MEETPTRLPVNLPDFTGPLDLLVMLIGLNPIMGSDLIYGQNDSFVLAWIVLSLWLWGRGQAQDVGPPEGSTPDLSKTTRSKGSPAPHLQRAAEPALSLSKGAGVSRGSRGWIRGSAAAFGLACASKPTAWFLAPFYVLLLAGGDTTDLWRRPGAWLRRAWRAGWPAVVVTVLIVGPYLVWDAAAMFDDVWRWSSGTSPTAYQIWGWGASNLILALGWVQSRFDYWPFWLPQLLLGVPLMAGLLWRQMRDNHLARALWSYGLFLFAFFFVSRFLNENYLGYVLAFLVLGMLVETKGQVNPGGDTGGKAPGAASQPEIGRAHV